MSETVRPYVPAMFCATLSVLTLTSRFAMGFMTNSPQLFRSDDVAFFCFLPMCFYIFGDLYARLQKENQDLRARVDAISAKQQ